MKEKTLFEDKFVGYHTFGLKMDNMPTESEEEPVNGTSGTESSPQPGTGSGKDTRSIDSNSDGTIK